MPIVKFLEWGYVCLRCGHRWVPRGLIQRDDPKNEAKTRKRPVEALDAGPKPVEPKEEPEVCPLCKSPYWHKPRTTETKKSR